MTIGQKIKAYLRDHGLKQVYLSERLGCSASALSSALTANRNMSVEMYAKICNLLKVDLDYFIKN